MLRKVRAGVGVNLEATGREREVRVPSGSAAGLEQRAGGNVRWGWPEEASVCGGGGGREGRWQGEEGCPWPTVAGGWAGR